MRGADDDTSQLWCAYAKAQSPKPARPPRYFFSGRLKGAGY